MPTLLPRARTPVGQECDLSIPKHMANGTTDDGLVKDGRSLSRKSKTRFPKKKETTTTKTVMCNKLGNRIIKQF